MLGPPGEAEHHEELRKGKMLGKAGRRKVGIGQRGGGGLSPEHSAGGASWGRAIIPTPRDGSDILFTRKEPFSSPCFPEKKNSEQEKEKPSQAH